MKGSATITFSQAGVEPPVYVVTSLSNPPWATLELTPGEKTPSGDIVFRRQFENTPEGKYQYKVRIGEGHWVVDESKESATDEQGNRNNVVHVEHASETDASTSRLAEKDNSSKEPVRNRNDSTMDVRLPVAPVPFVMVEKVTDKEQPEYGDVEPEHLPTDASKRAADAEPDFERVRKDIVSPDHNLLPIDTDEDAAPLFRHESFQASESSHSLPDGVKAESLQSSTGMSSGDAMDTPSETAESQDDELNLAPLLSHETRFSAGVHEPGGPLLSHEHDEADEHDELSLAPLLSHESGFSLRDEDERSEDEDELHLAPLLSHESDFSQQKHSEGNFARDEDDWGPQHYQHGRQSKPSEARPALQHRDSLLDEEHLLPHERTSAGSFSGSERSYEHNSIPDTNQPTHGYETEYAREIFGGGRPTFFRTNSSTLPHRLPKTDEEDHDLRDASLEQFPVGRDQILARVATIGNKLPEDETIASPHSPQGSTFSQACSSVDLVPVKSYISLASVREDEEEEEEEGDDDNDSVSSPIFMSSSSAAFARDPLATPHSNDSKQLGPIPEDKSEIKSEKPDMRTIETSESESVNRTDGAMDSSKDPSKASGLVGAHATPSQTLTPPLTPEPKTLPVESELRQRREPAKDQTGIYTTASSRQLENQNHTLLSSIIRFLTSCIGTRKRASVAALVVVAAYCWVTLRQ